MEQIRLDIVPKGIPPVCHASQYDDGRIIRLNLMDGLQGYTLSDETIELDVRKPDGHIVTSSVTVESGKAYVDIVTTEQMCAVEGENICELKISKDGAEIYSLNFKMKVEKSVLEGGDPSESFIHNLNEQIYDAVAEQYSGDVIFDDEPTASHGEGYAVTSEGIKTAIENIELKDLHDVTITSPALNQAIVRNASNTGWENGTVSTVGSLDDLNDVDTTGKTENSSVVWNGNDKFIAKKLTVTLTQAEYDQLKLDGDLVEGTNYVITDGQNVTCDLGDLDDVSISGSMSVGQVVAFNGTNWINSNAIINLNTTVSQFSSWTTSTTSFVDACSKLGIYSAIGTVLDSLKTNIGSYTGNTINNRVDSSQGPVYFLIFGKANDNYFTGILLSYFYNDSSRQPIMFTYSSGTYVVKKI